MITTVIVLAVIAAVLGVYIILDILLGRRKAAVAGINLYVPQATEEKAGPEVQQTVKPAEVQPVVDEPEEVAVEEASAEEAAEDESSAKGGKRRGERIRIAIATKRRLF